MPFNATDRGSMIREIIDGLPDLFSTGELDDTSDDCRDLLDWMLVANPEKRASAEDALAHPWFADLRDVKHADQKQAIGQVAQSQQDADCGCVWE
jgi:serine/threonine protein kinase